MSVARRFGRHRTRRQGGRRAAAPLAAGAVLLAAAVAATTAAADPVTVAGSPVAGAAAPERPAKKKAFSKPMPRPAPTTATTPAPPPPPASPQAPPPEQRQAPGTVRLAGGGTATLVRKDVVDGVLPVPEGVREATWWGAALDAPSGATVLAGHVNWQGATGPFAELWTAALGDPVTVVTDDGRTHRFRVRQLVTVHKNDLPGRAQELFGQDGNHRLVLVTCGGRWVGGRDGYEENRVVIADPE